MVELSSAVKISPFSHQQQEEGRPAILDFRCYRGIVVRGKILYSDLLEMSKIVDCTVQ